MPEYSVSEARNNLSKLIDEAVTGIEVSITRHGKPAVRLVAVAADESVEPAAPRRALSAEALAELAEVRSLMPKLDGLSWVEDVRRMREE
jgi:prevent-host-death family protein